MSRRHRVFAASVQHETHSFNRFETTRERFAEDYLLTDPAAIVDQFDGTDSAIGGFIIAAKRHG